MSTAAKKAKPAAKKTKAPAKPYVDPDAFSRMLIDLASHARSGSTPVGALSREIMPPPPDGYTDAAWLALYADGPVTRAMHDFARAPEDKSRAAGLTFMDLMFSNNLKAFRARAIDDDSGDPAPALALDGRGILALAIARYLMSHSKQVDEIRELWAGMDDYDRRSLWASTDALDVAMEAAFPPLQDALNRAFNARAATDEDGARLASVMHEALIKQQELGPWYEELDLLVHQLRCLSVELKNPTKAEAPPAAVPAQVVFVGAPAEAPAPAPAHAPAAPVVSPAAPTVTVGMPSWTPPVAVGAPLTFEQRLWGASMQTKIGANALR